MSQEQEWEDTLRRAFVEKRADFIVIYSRRQRFQIDSANYGVDQGWINGEWDDSDEQSTEWIGRLTQKGKEHFGV